MISRAILLSTVIGWSGVNLMPPSEPPPLTAAQMQAKAKYRSVSAVCHKKKKSKTVKELCKRWGQHDA